MSGGLDLDPRYVAARRVLLDALTSLAPHGRAVVVVGAQAVYLRTGGGEVATTIAAFTTDGDLALDPTLLGDEPELAKAMIDAGFRSNEPGIWNTTARVAGQDVVVPIDLIVPEAASTGEGRRGARLGPHGNRAARRAVGLEAALVDHSRSPSRLSRWQTPASSRRRSRALRLSSWQRPTRSMTASPPAGQTA